MHQVFSIISILIYFCLINFIYHLYCDCKLLKMIWSIIDQKLANLRQLNIIFLLLFLDWLLCVCAWVFGFLCIYFVSAWSLLTLFPSGLPMLSSGSFAAMPVLGLFAVCTFTSLCPYILWVSAFRPFAYAWFVYFLLMSGSFAAVLISGLSAFYLYLRLPLLWLYLICPLFACIWLSCWYIFD